MWLDHAGGNLAQARVSGEFSIAMPASYRRGILRAKVTVSDLSRWTATFSAMETLKPGTLIWLTLPGLEAKQATVAWSDGFVSGVRFEAPLHPAVLDAVLEGRL